MESSTHDSGEGSDPEESSQESTVTEIKMCVEEIQPTDGIAKKFKRWYKEFGFEEMDNAKPPSESGRNAPQSAGRYV